MNKTPPKAYADEGLRFSAYRALHPIVPVQNPEDIDVPPDFRPSMQNPTSARVRPEAGRAGNLLTTLSKCRVVSRVPRAGKSICYGNEGTMLVLPVRIELTTSALPRFRIVPPISMPACLDRGFRETRIAGKTIAADATETDLTNATADIGWPTGESRSTSSARSRGQHPAEKSPD